ncbi:MAG: hypothetical protein J7M15_04515, partial [Anaerolineae bacterium]|nr:hypothetical protein [Anaerolineae bacterium]
MDSSRWATMGRYATTELLAFRRRLLLAAAVLSFYDVWLFLPYGTSSTSFDASGYASLALGTLLAVGVYLLRDTRTDGATALFLVGQLALQPLVAWQHGELAALVRLALLPLVAAMLAGRWVGILMALAALGEALWLQRLAASPILSADWVGVWVALTGLGYLVDGALGTMDTLECDLADTQRNQVEQLRDHQG